MILVTGASKGIGKYLFEEYLRKKEDIIGIYNSTFDEKNNGNYSRLILKI